MIGFYLMTVFQLCQIFAKFLDCLTARHSRQRDDFPGTL